MSDQHIKTSEIPVHVSDSTCEYVLINDTEIPVLAYMHATSDTCVTSALPDGRYVYANPRKLIAYDDVADHVDWLEKGVAEWRAVAIAEREQFNGKVVVPVALYRAWQGLLLLENDRDEVNARIYLDIIKDLMQEFLPKEDSRES